MKKVFKTLVLAFFVAWMITYTGCKKNAEIPTLTTTTVSGITTTSAVTGGDVTSSGGEPVITRGVCWSTAHNPTVAGSKTIDETGTGSFTSSITGLTPNTTYYVRAYATNSVGTAYGNEIGFTIQDLPPSPDVTTSAVTSITSFSAVSGGTLFHIQKDYVSESGVCWSTSRNPTYSNNKTINETGELNFISNLSDLTPGTTYYVRAYAIYGTDLDNDIIYGNELSFTTSPEQGTGTQKADFPGVPRYGARGFSIGTNVYIGLGLDKGSFQLNDFWEWDQTTNVWTRKADYPGHSIGGEVGFSIGTKGYIGAGTTNEFWEYDPATNKWTQKSSVPGTYGIVSAVGFSIGAKGYIGTGSLYDGVKNAFSQDFWEWDQATDIWTKKAGFPGNGRTGAVGFSIGNKGYIGTGDTDGIFYSKDFWEWDQATNVWTQKADFAGVSRHSAVGFSIGNKGYIGTGINFLTSVNFKKDFWEWDQATDVWTQKTSLAGKARAGAVGFPLGDNAYIGTGFGSEGNIGYVLKDFWEYDPNLK